MGEYCEAALFTYPRGATEYPSMVKGFETIDSILPGSELAFYTLHMNVSVSISTR